MAIYGIIEGEDPAAPVSGEALTEALDDAHYLGADEDLNDEFYGELRNCDTILLLGDVGDQKLDRVKQLRGVHLTSDHDYGDNRVIPFDTEDLVQNAYMDAVRNAPEYARAEQLKEAISGKDSIAIAIHNNPDPDAIASALAFKHIANHYNVDADIYHGGEVNHQENKALVNKLEISMKNESIDLDKYDQLALLDTGQTNVDVITYEDALADVVDIVIDHHPSWDGYADVISDFYDVQPDRGATSSMMADYLRLLDIEPSKEVATALIHGIRSDTNGLNPNTRTFTIGDVAANHYLYGFADEGSLRDILKTTMTTATADTLAQAIENRDTLKNTTLFSYVGDVEETDAIPQAADYLIQLEGIETAIVAGVEDTESVRISARSSDIKMNVGRALHNVFEDNPSFQDFGLSGGGDGREGGAEIPLDAFGIGNAPYDDGGDNDALHVFIEDWLKKTLTDIGKES